MNLNLALLMTLDYCVARPILRALITTERLGVMDEAM